MSWPAPVVVNTRPGRCVFCKLEPGEATVARAPNGKAVAARLACPACGFADVVELMSADRVFEQSRPETIDRLTPGWQCPYPTCRKQVTIVGGRYVVA